ncbi:MAG: type II secretion system protein [Chloroflexota bacterium]
MRNKTGHRQRGFTLIELVVVIAILGVLAAVAVPLVTGYLGSAKERAYKNDVKQVQAAVDAYYSAPDNVKFTGTRQYPIKGMDSSGSLNTWTAGDTGDLTSAVPLNPLKGTIGCNPKWRDGGDGIRTEENLNAEAASLAGTGSGWYVVDVTRQSVHYVVDTRNCLIDFTKLTVDDRANGKIMLLEKVPSSASLDNTGGAATGSYSYYVDANGKVNSVYYHFPTNGVVADGGTNNGPDNRGLVTGVYP